MSHFTVLVVTKNGTDAEIEHQLAPFHEFECTGNNDEFIQNIDEMPELLEDYGADTVRRLVAQDGSIHDPYDAKFKRARTAEERAKASPFDRDTTVFFVPDGFTERQVPIKDVLDFVGFCTEWHGRARLDGAGAPDLEGEHKYGWARVVDGKVTEVIDRTNPNARWDWYTVGGRWSGYFTLKHGGVEANGARKSDIDFERMMDKAGADGGAKWDSVRSVIGKHLTGYKTWETVRVAHGENYDEARKEYGAQPAVAALRASKDMVWENVDDFLCSREEYVASRRRSAVRTFAFLRDRKWAQKGDMGWWGVVLDEKADWPAQFEELLADVPADYHLTVVDCHI